MAGILPLWQRRSTSGESLVESDVLEMRINRRGCKDEVQAVGAAGRLDAKGASRVGCAPAR